MSMCQVCGQQNKKYQCPKCDIKYCSLPCFKSHKETCVDASVPPSLSSSPSSQIRPSLIFIDEEEDTVVPQEKLEWLGSSDELKRILSNEHLRHFLTHLNTTHNPKGFMRIAMQEPLFLEFADKCIHILHPELNKDVTLEQVQDMVEEAVERAEEDQ